MSVQDLVHIGVCRICGCTDDEACWPLGCSWAEQNRCTACPDLKVGQQVRVGQGTAVWIITGFDRWPDGGKYAALAPASDAAYTNRTSTLDRLTAV